MIGLTHAVFAWLLAIVFALDPVIVVMGSLFPDAELILPVPHRGFLHSVLLMLPACLFILFLDRVKGLSFGAGVFSHLFLDSFTAQGLPVFYLLLKDYFSLHFYNSDNLNWLVVVVSMVLIANSKKIFKKGFSSKWLFAGFAVWLFFLVTFKFVF